METLIQYLNQITPSMCNNHWAIVEFRKESSNFSFNSSFKTFCKSEKIVNLRTIISPGQFLVSGASGKGGRESPVLHVVLPQSLLCYSVLFRDQTRQKLSNVILFC